MDDLQATKLCAEALGLDVIEIADEGEEHWLAFRGDYPFSYAPLTNDRQAMALVKRFRLNCNGEQSWWDVEVDDAAGTCAEDNDLNRAIVYCVAKMQDAK